MKKFISLLSILSLVLIFSCRDDHSTEGKSSPKVRKMALKINGTLKTYDTVVASAKNLAGMNGTIVTGSVNGSSSDNFQMFIYEKKTGTDTFEKFAVELNYNGKTYYCVNSEYSFLVQITENDTKKLKGTFSGKLFNATELNITNGEFEYEY